jgi:hypothetical protein
MVKQRTQGDRGPTINEMPAIPPRCGTVEVPVLRIHRTSQLPEQGSPAVSSRWLVREHGSTTHFLNRTMGHRVKVHHSDVIPHCTSKPQTRYVEPICSRRALNFSLSSYRKDRIATNAGAKPAFSY